MTWERLGQLPHTHVDFLLITYEPGGIVIEQRAG